MFPLDGPAPSGPPVRAHKLTGAETAAAYVANDLRAMERELNVECVHKLGALAHNGVLSFQVPPLSLVTHPRSVYCMYCTLLAAVGRMAQVEAVAPPLICDDFIVDSSTCTHLRAYISHRRVYNAGAVASVPPGHVLQVGAVAGWHHQPAARRTYVPRPRKDQASIGAPHQLLSFPAHYPGWPCAPARFRN